MRCLFAVIFLLLSHGAYSYERISGVYEAVVAIDDRSEATRNRAIREGLEQVLVRYTGYSKIANFADLEAELQSAQRYVIEYGVETVKRELPDGLGVEKGDSLWIRYNTGLIDQLADTLELPIWPILRPTVSYAIVNQRWDIPHIPALAERPALYLHLEQLFQQRGLDAQVIETKGRNTVEINAEALWSMDDSTLIQLHESTNTDITIVMRVQQASSSYNINYSIDFLFLSSGSETLMRREASELNQALDIGLNSYIDNLSTTLAFLGGASVELELYMQVEDVRAYGDYRKLLDQITGLEQVVFVRMDKANDRGISYLIRYQSDQALLIESIEAITGLQSLPEDTFTDASCDKVLALPGSVNSPINFAYPGYSTVRKPQNQPGEGC